MFSLTGTYGRIWYTDHCIPNEDFATMQGCGPWRVDTEAAGEVNVNTFSDVRPGVVLHVSNRLTYHWQ